MNERLMAQWERAIENAAKAHREGDEAGFVAFLDLADAIALVADEARRIEETP